MEPTVKRGELTELHQKYRVLRHNLYDAVLIERVQLTVDGLAATLLNHVRDRTEGIWIGKWQIDRLYLSGLWWPIQKK